MKLAFVDVETTGLYPEHGHEIWDIGLIHRWDEADDAEYQWFIEPDRTIADPGALPVGGYYQRTRNPKWSDPAEVAPRLARLLDGAVLVGSSTWFDAGFLQAFLRRHGECGTWSRHLVDVRQRAIGYLLGQGAVASRRGRTGRRLVEDGRTSSRAVGVDLGQFRAHEALEDARIARAVYDATGGAS